VKKSALSVFVGATLVLTSLLGCDAIKSDLSSYSKTAVPIYNSYSEKLGVKFDASAKASSKEEYLADTKEIIAQLDEFRGKMEAVKPETKEVQDLHQSCITNLANMEEGSKQIVEAIEKQDETLSQSAKAKIEDAVKADEKFRSDLKALEDKHHVQVQ
jgi:septal ring factor EnvC (AmiA/AmiB activator)